MANPLENAIARTRVLARLAKASGLDDRQLLRNFAAGDESAFTILVERHGPLVMGACRRILQHTQDAEDAFQATFLVLARKAGKVGWEESIANWLYGVACRVSFQLRRKRSRKPSNGGPWDNVAAKEPDPAWSELRPVLDEELARLPERYRKPLILCCLEGKSRDEAAALLGWSVGSVKGRLERGRELLRSRLAKRGLMLSAALTALFVGNAAHAAVSATLAVETVRFAGFMLAGETGLISTPVLSLAQGALHAMFMTKIKIAAAILMGVLTVGLGAGYATHQALAGGERTGGASAGQRSGGEGRSEAPTVTGFIKQVDADKNKITVITSRDNADGDTYDVAKDLKIVIRDGRESKEGKFADLEPRTSVKLVFDDAKKTVRTIEIQTPGERERGGERGGREAGNFHTGVVTEVDAAKKTITFQVGGRGEPATTKTFDLAKDVKVTIHIGRTVKEGKLADVPLNTVVRAKLDDAKKTVQAIEVTVSTSAGGTVSEIGADSITLTSGGRGGDEKSTTYKLAKDAKVQYRAPGVPGQGRGDAKMVDMKLAEVAAKMNVTVQLDDELKTVQVIYVSLPSMNGSVQSVDAKKLTILVRPPRGTDDAMFNIAKDAVVIVNAKAGALSDVAVGAEVHLVLSPDRSQVIFLQTPPPQGR